jgi:hypothetical protein
MGQTGSRERPRDTKLPSKVSLEKASQPAPPVPDSQFLEERHQYRSQYREWREGKSQGAPVVSDGIVKPPSNGTNSAPLILYPSTTSASKLPLHNTSKSLSTVPIPTIAKVKDDSSSITVLSTSPPVKLEEDFGKFPAHLHQPPIITNK